MSDDFFDDTSAKDMAKDMGTEDEGRRRPDTDLSGMDPESAREYVLAFLTTLKETQKQAENARKDRELWEQRVELSRSKGESELELKAQIKVNEIQSKIERLNAEEESLKAKVLIMKDELKRLKNAPELSSVDPDLLLAQLEMIVGKPDKTAQAFREHEAETELERLKKKIQEEDS